MGRFVSFPIFIASVLLIGSIALLAPQAYADHDNTFATTYEVTENTSGPVTFDTTSTYTIASTDSDSQKFEFNESQELSFKSANIPDYENPADADTDNDYVITLEVSSADVAAHEHEITIRVTDIAAPSQPSPPNVETQVEALEASWTASTHPHVTGYTVKFSAFLPSGDFEETITVSATTTSAGIGDLDSDHPYTITMRVETSEGNSPWSSTIAVTPLPLPLDPNHPQDPSSVDVGPTLGSVELSQLGALLTFDTLIFNELHNGSDDANDWLELRNVSSVDIPLDTWQLTIRTGDGTVIVPFPADTVIPAGEVLLVTNAEMPTADASVLSVVAETFALPQTDFALILRDPIAFGDITGNYVQGEDENPQTTPALTVDTTWERTQPIVFGYRAEAWTQSTYQDGLGTPGYRHPASTADLNSDGVVNILDLVLVASQFGTTNAAADLNADGTVDIDDLVFVANAWGSVAGAP